MRNTVFLKVLAAVAAALLASLTVVISLPRPPAQTTVQAKAKTAIRYIQPYNPVVQMLAAKILMQANTSDLWSNLAAMYRWVVLNIRYQAEPARQDYWQTPTETLSNGTGDCEDFAILLCSLVLAYNSTVPAECVVIGSPVQVAGWAGHVAVAIPFGTDICILDPAGQYYTQTGTVTKVKDGYMLVGGDGRVTKKPAAEEVNLWLLGWADKLPDARVACTFSMATEKNFDDTAGFLSWTASTTGGGN
jgi:hypothetical protein